MTVSGTRFLSMVIWLSVGLAGGRGWAEERPSQAPAGSGDKPSGSRLEPASVRVPVNLQRIRAELAAELSSFEDSGVVSIESGAACLESSSSEAQASPTEGPNTTQVDSLPAQVRVLVTIPPPQAPDL